MGQAKTYYIAPAFAFVAYPNRDSTPFREFYNIPEAETIVRGTLRYQGFPEFVKALVQLGWLDAEKKDWLKNGITWAEATQKLTAAPDASEKYVHCIITIWPNLRIPISLAPSSTASRTYVNFQMNPRLLG